MSPDKPANVNIWYLTRYMRGYRWPVTGTLVFLAAGRLASSLDPVWLKKIIDGVTKGGTLQSMGAVIVTYFFIRFLSFFFDFLRDLVFAPAEMGIARTLSQELFTRLVSLQVSYHHDQKIGGISRQITRGGRAVTFILDFLVINILPTLVELAMVTILLLRLYSPVYAAITVGTIVLYTWFTVWATEKRQKFRLGAINADDEVAGVEGDAMANIETVKYFNNEARMQERYRPAIENRYKLSVASNQLFALVSSGQGFILLVGMGAILLMAVDQTVRKVLTIGDLVLLTTYVSRLSAPIGVLGFVYRAIKDGLADLDGMAKILAEPITVKEPEHPVAITRPAGRVEFDDIQFGYTGKPPVFKGLTFTVEPGQRIAFVGPSGVGKSTVVKLLFRFYDPTAGQIRIDGVDLACLDKETRRAMFAIVPQEPVLFNATIGENIRFGKPDATQEEVEEAARLASIAHFIERLPDKYETQVGERGVKLSGGEKQRVAIARAIIRQPRILVFDEATSSLDSRSEREIQEALDTVSLGRTTLAVAHRLSTIANSDIIFVLDHGKIAEQGKHEDLLALGGIYAHLWQIQAEARERGVEDDELKEIEAAEAAGVS